MFRIPVTVCVPEPEPQAALSPTNNPRYVFKDLAFTPGHIIRKFVTVPVGATWAEVTFTATGYDSKCTFISQNVCLPKVTAHRNSQFYKAFGLGGTEVKQFSIEFPVYEQHSMEFCLAQYWNSLGQGSVTMDISFHGLRPSAKPITLSQSAVTRVDLSSTLGPEVVKPTLSLTEARRTLQPSSYALSALTERDRLPNGKTAYQLVLSYEWEAKAKCKVNS